MKPYALLILGLCGLLAAVLLASVVTGALAAVAAPSPAELARQYAEADRVRQDAAIAAQWAPVRAAAWNLFLPALGVGAAAYAFALARAHVRRVERERLPNAAGLLPVLAADQDTARAALAGFHQARIEDARRTLVPAHYSPTISYAPRHELERRAEGPALLPAAELPQIVAPAVPSFGELLDAGRVGRGQPLLLGFDAEAGGELAGDWRDLYATALAGLPGSGKTTSQRFFAAQTALHGARFVVCDPHAGAADDSLAATLAPLSSCYLVEPAEEPRAILQAVRYVADLGEARIKGRDASTTPIILWVDELTGLLGRSDVGDELAGLLERIAQECRKRFVYLSASGQIWTAARTTTELRDSLASVLCHRMKRSQARLLLPTEEAAQVERLATGEAILWRTSGQTTRVVIPLTTADDVRRVGALLAGGAPAEASGVASAPRSVGFRPPASRGDQASRWKPDGSLMEASSVQASTAPVRAEAARALALFQQGYDVAQIVRELYGVEAASGRRYQDAAREVQRLIREALGQREVQP